MSEDILYDGRKSLENGLPIDGDLSKVDETNWGRVPKLQPVINAFDSNPTARYIAGYWFRWFERCGRT
jgi:cell surface protein SprA